MSVLDLMPLRKKLVETKAERRLRALRRERRQLLDAARGGWLENAFAGKTKWIGVAFALSLVALAAALAFGGGASQGIAGSLALALLAGWASVASDERELRLDCARAGGSAQSLASGEKGFAERERDIKRKIGAAQEAVPLEAAAKSRAGASARQTRSAARV
jgi:hypothetical protein